MQGLDDEALWRTRFQAAALEPGKWLETLQQLADATGSARAELVGFGDGIGASFNWVTASTPRMIEDFAAIEGGRADLNYRLAASRGPLELVHEYHYEAAFRGLAGDDYRDFCSDYHIPFGVQTLLLGDSDELIGLSVLRSETDGRSDEEARRVFASAASAARDAVLLQRRIEGDGASLIAGAMEVMAIACLLLDGRGRVQAMTPAAERLVAGGAVRLAGRRLASDAAEAALVTLLERGAGMARVEGLAGEAAIELHALPPRDWNFGFSPRVMAIVREGAGSDRLAARFGLTAAEAAIALRLAEGASRETIAVERGVSLQTLRTQIRSIYHKTGCHREAALVALLGAALR